MTRVDLHPDTLFDGLRNGRLDDEERARLQTHCAYCEPCRFELCLIEDARIGTDDPADAAQLARAALHGLFVAKPVETREATLPPKHRVRVVAWLTAALVLGCSMGAAAMVTQFPERLAQTVGSWFSRRTPALAVPVEPRVVNRAWSTAAEAGSNSDLNRGPQGDTPNLADTRSAVMRERESSSGEITGAQPATRVKSPGSARRSRGLGSRAQSVNDQADAEAALSLATQARARGERGEAAERYRYVIERFGDGSVRFERLARSRDRTRTGTRVAEGLASGALGTERTERCHRAPGPRAVRAYRARICARVDVDAVAAARHRASVATTRLRVREPAGRIRRRIINFNVGLLRQGVRRVIRTRWSRRFPASPKTSPEASLPHRACVLLVLEAHHQIGGVANDVHLAARVPLSPLLGPQVEHVVQVEIRQ